jgi:Questin oxidase-like
MRAPLYTTLDDALDAQVPFGIELKNGNSNHAPMVAEALCALGRPEAVMPWLGRYQDRMAPRPAVVDPIHADDWRSPLGRRERFGDWSLFFAEALREAPWRAVLDLWLGRLGPGFAAAATHGVIRVGHAVRGLAECETPPRLRELADALASWAATYRELPGGDWSPNGKLTPSRAIAEVPLVPPARRRPGNIVAALGALSDFPEFALVAGLIENSGAPAALIAELSETFARVCLTNARDIPTGIAFIHGVTSQAALGNIAPHVGEATARAALRHAWQTGCALYACYGSSTATAEEAVSADQDADALAERAIANGDEHAIKFTEACLSRNAICPSQAYPVAIVHVLGLIRPRRPG